MSDVPEQNDGMQIGPVAFPGHAAFADGFVHKETFGNRFAIITGDTDYPEQFEKAVNEWFAARAGQVLVTDWKIENCTMYIFYTMPIDDATKEVIKLQGKVIERLVREEKASREAKIIAAEEAVKKEEEEAVKKHQAHLRELERLADLGRSHESNCGKKKVKK